MLSRHGSSLVAVALAVVAQACSGGSTSSPSSSSPSTSTNLSASEVAAAATSLVGGISGSLQSGVSNSSRSGLSAVSQVPSLLQALTIQVPYTAITPPRVPCQFGGSYDQTGGISGTATDTGLVKISGTVIIVHHDCANFAPGALQNGDPYLSTLLDFTQTGTPWSLTITMSGSWSIQIPGRPLTRASIDPSGIHVTMGSTGSNRIQGSVTSYPGGVSTSLNTTF